MHLVEVKHRTIAAWRDRALDDAETVLGLQSIFQDTILVCEVSVLICGSLPRVSFSKLTLAQEPPRVGLRRDVTDGDGLCLSFGASVHDSIHVLCGLGMFGESEEADWSVHND